MTVVDRFPRRVREIAHCWIPLADGTRLAAKIWLPADAEADPVPAILEYIPYRQHDGTAERDALMHPYVAGHGYAVARVDLRGCGNSEGICEDEYTRQELADGVEVIAWLARQPWCTGAVGMMGISWGGFNALQIAALQPPALKAIVTVGSTDDRYATDVHYFGGCLAKDNLDWGATMLAYTSRPPDPAVVGERWRAMWLARLEALAPWVFPWMEHQRRDAYWKHGSVCEDFAAIRCPVYAINGWADNYRTSIPRLLAGLDGPRKGLIGPWAHCYPHDGRPGPAIGFLQEALRWWDQWLKGKDTGILQEPMYRVWMQESQPPRPFYAERPGRWVAEPCWPSPHIRWRELALNPSGLLEAEPAPEASLTLASPLTLGITAGEIGAYGTGAELPTDQREEDGGSLLFTGPPLAERVEILGSPVATLALAVDRPQALIAVRLNDVAPDGSSTRVTWGALNLTHRESHEHPTALEPGRRYRVRVVLDEIAHAFPAGHRIALALSTAYWPALWPSPQPATLTLVAGASRFALPVRPPRPEDDRLPPFARPETAPPLAVTPIRPARRNDRTILREVGSGATTVTFPRDSGASRLDAIGLETDELGAARYRIVEGDPLSMTAWTEWRNGMARGNWRVRTESRTRMTADARSFLITAELEAYEGEVRVFARTWHRRIPRDML